MYGSSEVRQDWSVAAPFGLSDRPRLQHQRLYSRLGIIPRGALHEARCMTDPIPHAFSAGTAVSGLMMSKPR